MILLNTFRSKAEEIIVPDYKLPEGWVKVKVQRKGGIRKGKWDVIVKR